MTTEHAQEADAPEAHHTPHILPLWTYFRTWLLLCGLTALTVGVSYVDFGPGNLIIALVVATTKATLVAMFFMHLLYDHKFHALIFGFSLIFLGIFIGFTLSDTSARGTADAIEGDRPVNIAKPFGGTQDEAERMQELVEHGFVPSADPGKDPSKLSPPQIPISEATVGTAPAPAPAPAPATPASAPTGTAAAPTPTPPAGPIIHDHTTPTTRP